MSSQSCRKSMVSPFHTSSSDNVITKSNFSSSSILKFVNLMTEQQILKSKTALVMWIYSDNLLFALVESRDFINWIETLRPFSKITFRRDMICPLHF